MEAGGFERTPLALSKTPISETACAKSGAPIAPDTPVDPDLARIVAACPVCMQKLPERIRQAVLTIVRGTSEKEQTL